MDKTRQGLLPSPSIKGIWGGSLIFPRLQGGQTGNRGGLVKRRGAQTNAQKKEKYNQGSETGLAGTGGRKVEVHIK